MSDINISVALLHSPTAYDREDCVLDMCSHFPSASDVFHARIFNDAKPEGMSWAEFKTVLALHQWEWSLSTMATHHLFLTDDLHLHPEFWEVLHAMVAGRPDAIIGLLSNHPQAAALDEEGYVWYRCNSWVVGPAYLVPRAHLESFVAWYKALPDTEETHGRRWFNDDSALNHWITFNGPGESWHPLPTPIEHRDDLPSTVGHGDRYSRERASWRYRRRVVDLPDGGFAWESAAVEPIKTLKTGIWAESLLLYPRILEVGGE